MVSTAAVPKRRTAFGTLLTEAPWDGRAKSPTPLRIPATLAARVAPAPQYGALPPSKQRRRLPFGQLLAGAPWTGPRPAPAPTPEAE